MSRCTRTMSPRESVPLTAGSIGVMVFVIRYPAANGAFNATAARLSMVAHGLPAPSCVRFSVPDVQGNVTLRGFAAEAGAFHAIVLSVVPSEIRVCPLTGVLSNTLEKRCTASLPHRFDV